SSSSRWNASSPIPRPRATGAAYAFGQRWRAGATGRVRWGPEAPRVPRHLASGHIASSARSPPRSPTASGLALARELIQAQGGTVDWREASPGTVFVATLAWQN